MKRASRRRFGDLSMLEYLVVAAIAAAVVVGFYQLGEGLYMRAEAKLSPSRPAALETGSIATPLKLPISLPATRNGAE